MAQRAIQMRDSVIVGEEPAGGASGASGPDGAQEDEFEIFQRGRNNLRRLIDTLGKIILDMRNDQKRDDGMFEYASL